jgi:hypothetical protein
MSFLPLTKRILGNIKNHPERVNWYYLSNNYLLPEDILRQNDKYICFLQFSYYQSFSEQFFDDYADRVDFYKISRYQQLSEAFIERHSQRVNWHNIGRYQKLSDEFIFRNLDKLNFRDLLVNKHMMHIIDSDFVKANSHKILKELYSAQSFPTQKGNAHE